MPSKKPQDHKRPTKTEKSSEGGGADFVFEHNGVEYTLPRFGDIKQGILRKTRKLPDGDGLFTLLEHVASEETLEAIDDMTADQLNDTVSQWMEHSGVTLGE